MKELEKVVLENGLTIYLLNDNSKHTTIANLIVNFGGLDTEVMIEGKRYNIKNGTAHFLEHLVLESSSYGDLMNIFGKNAIRSNGLTSLNNTRFYIDTVEDIYENLELLIKGIHNPIFDEKVIENIRKPILEEKRTSLDNKYSNLYNANVNSLLNNKNFKSILGDLKDIESIKLKDLKFCFNTFYKPTNEVIVIIGRFDRNNIIKVIEETYNSLSFNDDYVEKIIRPFKKKVNKKKSVVKGNTNIGRTVISFKLDTIDLTSYDKLMLDLYLFSFLKMNFGVMSKLNKSMIKDNIIVGNIQFSSSILEGYHIVRIEANTNYSKIFEKEIIDFVLNKKYVFSKDLFELYKKGYIVELISRNDNLYTILEPLIENIITFKYEALDEVKDIENMSFEAFIAKIESLNFNNYTITKLESLK